VPAAGASPAHVLSRALEALSLEQYASYCAELAAYPHHAAQVHARYGVASADQKTLLDDQWASRLKADPALLAQWQQHYAYTTQWLGRQGR